MTKEELFAQIKLKSSYLCVGLDTDIDKIPRHLLKENDPIATFNQAIIEATHDVCVSYKPNIAFYEAYGTTGWESLAKTLACIPETHFTIADAKRGDIGNTSLRYAKTFFEQFECDAVTVAPYMGADSVTPFLAYKEDKWVIVLGLTSNSGASDFQTLKLDSGQMLYQSVLEKAAKWGTDENMMFVIGATKAETFGTIRRVVPHHFLLVPGVGAQGGDLKMLSQYGMNTQCGLLVNASRSILYASDGKDFAKAARREAKKIQSQMTEYLDLFL